MNTKQNQSYIVQNCVRERGLVVKLLQSVQKDHGRNPRSEPSGVWCVWVEHFTWCCSGSFSCKSAPILAEISLRLTSLASEYVVLWSQSFTRCSNRVKLQTYDFCSSLQAQLTGFLFCCCFPKPKKKSFIILDSYFPGPGFLCVYQYTSHQENVKKRIEKMFGERKKQGTLAC